MRKTIHSPEYAAIRRKLVALRQKSGLSQRALAARLGVQRSWVAKVESGERRLDIVEFFRVCQACGANPPECARLFLESMTGAGE